MQCLFFNNAFSYIYQALQSLATLVNKYCLFNYAMTNLSVYFPQKSLLTLSATFARCSNFVLTLLSSPVTTTINQSGMLRTFNAACHSAISSFPLCLYVSISWSDSWSNQFDIKALLIFSSIYFKAIKRQNDDLNLFYPLVCLKPKQRSISLLFRLRLFQLSLSSFDGQICTPGNYHFASMIHLWAKILSFFNID